MHENTITQFFLQLRKKKEKKKKYQDFQCVGIPSENDYKLTKQIISPLLSISPPEEFENTIFVVWFAFIVVVYFLYAEISTRKVFKVYSR